MPAFTLSIPAAGDLPTTTGKVLAALEGLVVSIDEGHGNPYDVMVKTAIEGDSGVSLLVHPLRRDLGQGYSEADTSTTTFIPLDLIERIEVH